MDIKKELLCFYAYLKKKGHLNDMNVNGDMSVIIDNYVASFSNIYRAKVFNETFCQCEGISELAGKHKDKYCNDCGKLKW